MPSTPNRRNGGRTGRIKGQRPAAEIKADVLRFLALGDSVEMACAKVDRTPAAYRMWLARDPDFKVAVARTRAKLDGLQPDTPGDFGTWRETYLRTETYPHQWQWVDLIEGREPRDLHERQVYKSGLANRILVNTPPNHAKSTTLTMDYVVYRICQDPNVRIKIISASLEMAKQFLRGIKFRLEDPAYDALHQAFGPAGGFRVGAASWTETAIYVGNRSGVEKDPTVQALGMGGQLYGSRADLIICDDVIDLKHTLTKGARDKMMAWLRTVVFSRLEPKTGRLLVIGTRLSYDDLYQQLIRDDEKSVWTYLTQPAVLEWREDGFPEQTLWPERFPPEEIQAIIDDHGADRARFDLVYQQIDNPEFATFPLDAVNGCVRVYNSGYPLPDQVRPGGTTGLYVVAGLDPAASGYTAIVVLGVDKVKKHRYVLDVQNVKAIKPHDLRELMVRLTRQWNIKVWSVEKNGLQTLISQDRDLRLALLDLGARIHEHHTQAFGRTGKWDPDYGVATLSPLFLGALESPPAPMITLPSPTTSRAVKALVEQLVTWQPEPTGRTDIVMALWFADLAVRQALLTGSSTHVPNRWLTAGQSARRLSLRVDDLLTPEPSGVVLVG